MASHEKVFDLYVAHILSGLIASEGVDPGPLGPSEDIEYERMVSVAFTIADLAMRERDKWGYE